MRAGRQLAVVVVAALALAACGNGAKQGSGNESSETRTVAPFNRIALGAAADLVVAVGKPQKVVVRGDENLLDDLRTEVVSGKLEITVRPNVELDPKHGFTVEVSVPRLTELVVDGVGKSTLDDVRGPAFHVEVNGAGDVDANGKVDRLEVVLAGAGTLNLADLEAQHADVEIRGAGNVSLQATESLSASVSGAGNVVYTGNPSLVHSKVTGAGNITSG
jgi:hypothetical protein